MVDLKKAAKAARGDYGVAEATTEGVAGHYVLLAIIIALAIGIFVGATLF